MTRTPQSPSPLMKLANRIPRLLAERRIGGVHRQILVLETRGRRTGKAHRVPLGWVEMDSGFYLIAPRGEASDWLRNARADDRVTVTLHGRRRAMRAEDVTDRARKDAVLRAYAARYPQARRQITNATGSDDLATAAGAAGVLRLPPGASRRAPAITKGPASRLGRQALSRVTVRPGYRPAGAAARRPPAAGSARPRRRRRPTGRPWPRRWSAFRARRRSRRAP